MLCAKNWAAAPRVEADPPRVSLGHRRTGVTGFVEEDPVAELRIVEVGVEQGVGPVACTTSAPEALSHPFRPDSVILAGPPAGRLVVPTGHADLTASR